MVTVLAALCMGLTMLQATAQITYVDAIADSALGTSNTVATDGTPLSTWYNGTNNTSSVNATQWVRRNGSVFGNGANDVLQALGGGSNAIPEIKTTITGLTPGESYEIYTFFWDASAGEAWTLDSGLTSGTLTNASGGSSTDTALFTADGYASTLTFANSVVTGDSDPENSSGSTGNRDMLYTIVGAAVADLNGEVEVYIDQTSTDLTRRAWYDGVGYSSIAPIVTTYIDANESNTVAPSLASPSSFSTTNLSTDNLWRKRTGFGFNVNGNTEIYEKDASGGVGDAVPLETTITGLNPGQEYGIFACFLSPPSESWRVEAGVDANQLITLSPFAGPRIIDLGLSSVTNSNRNQYLGFVANHTADINGEITVFVDDGDGTGSDSRTWYEGVAYGGPYTIPVPPPPPPLPEGTVEVAPDGVWTWFNDERSIFHEGYLYSGYVRKDGHVGITRFDPITGDSNHMTLSDFQEVDDHNNPSITVIEGDRLLVTYARHNSRSEYYYRTSDVKAPGSDSDWNAQEVRSTPNASTYANTYRLSGETGKIYNFSRSINFNPTLTFSEDEGVTYGTPQHFISVGANSSIRPYPRYVSNDVDRIDLIYTDGHPREENNSIYHLYYENGAFRRSDGSVVKTVDQIPLEHGMGERGTEIYQFTNRSYDPGEGPDDFISNGRAWTWDIHYADDEEENIVCVFQAQVNNVAGGGNNFRNDRIYYYYARWDGTEWKKHYIAQAGSGIYNAERDYGGGMCLDPEDPRIVYISTNSASPFDLSVSSLNTVPLNTNNRYEIYRGFTADGGESFTWEAITQNSEEDNYRPIVPKDHSRTEALVWFTGRYTSFVDYDCRVVTRLGADTTDFGSYSEGQALSGNPSNDTDGDGFSDFFEFALQTDPNNISSIPATNLDGIELLIPGLGNRAGADILVESSTDLSQWDDAAIIRADHLPSTEFSGFSMVGDVMKRISSTDPNDTSRFFRISVSQ